MADFSAENLMTSAFLPLSEASVTYQLNTAAEYLAQPLVPSTTYYLMLGYDSILVTVPTVWTVTGSPDTTGAFSGNPTINAATIRVLGIWAA